MKLPETTTYSPILLNDEEKGIIENDILGYYFPWYYISKQTTYIYKDVVPKEIRDGEYVNGPFLSHSLLRRTEEEHIKHTERPIDHYSDGYYEFFVSIFHRWMQSNNLEYSNIFRANLNCNWYNGEDAVTVPHEDHTWPHYNWILYLTDNPGAPTLIWHENKWKEQPAEKYMVTNFEGCYHAHKYPKVGERRVVVVITYV